MNSLTPARSAAADDAARASYITPPRRGHAYPAAAAGAAGDAPSQRTTSLAASPAYATNYKKHSLYGFDDRVVLDPGSRVWKIGFSGEAQPRAVFDPMRRSARGSGGGVAEDNGAEEIWDNDLVRMAQALEASDPYVPPAREGSDGLDEEMEAPRDGARGASEANEGENTNEDVQDEVMRLVRARITRALRDAFAKHFLAEPTKRKVLVVRNALLPTWVQAALTRVLIENLEVPSVTFLPGHLTAVLAAGRTSGLVVDVGHLETTVLPVIGTRVIHNCMTTTPIAGREYLARLRLLLLSYGRYRPPPSHRPSSTTVAGASTTSARSSTSLEPSASEAAGMIDPASDMWTGGWVRVPHRVLSRAVLEDVRVRACRVARRGEVVPWNGQEVTPAMAQADEPETGGAGERNAEQDATLARDLYAAYGGTDVLPSVVFSVPDRPGASAGERGTLEVPDWVRLAVGEVFFEKGDEDQASIAEAILGSLAKISTDDRAEMARSIFVIGGGGMLSGLIPRLRDELIAALAERGPPSATRPDGPVTPQIRRQLHRTQVLQVKERLADPWFKLRGLRAGIAILNDPEGLGEAINPGSTPAWTPGLMSWVGASLAGSLQLGGVDTTTGPQGKSRPRYAQGTATDHGLSRTQRAEHELREVRATERRREVLGVPRTATRVRA